MAKDIKTYYEQLYIDNTLRLREILRTLPSFVRDYFRAIEPTTSAKTRISYAYDLRVFFNYLIDNNFINNKFLNKLNIEVEEDEHLILIYEYHEKDDGKCCYISKLRCNYNGCYDEILTYITIEEFIKVLSNYQYKGGNFVRNNTFNY